VIGEWLSRSYQSDFSRIFPSFIRVNSAAWVGAAAAIVLIVALRRYAFDLTIALVSLAIATGFLFARQPGVRIDLGGIAKGHAVDRGIAVLQALGIDRAMVNAGGDTRIIGDRLGRPWVVGIRHPDDEYKVVLRIPLTDTAMSTSGDYERYFEEDGVRYHHILDPDEGQPAHGCRSVTIVAKQSVLADGLSTGVFVLGPQAGMALIEKLPDVEGVIVTSENAVIVSTGLSGRLELRQLPTDAP
jgi:thiamine biosynthesis lipoprotein